MIPWVESIVDRLDALTQLCGYRVIWKSAADYNQFKIPTEYHDHTGNFCSMLKAYSVEVRKCWKCDVGDLHKRLMEGAEEFEKQCHAGLIEYIIPIRNETDYFGYVAIGPGRAKNAECKLPELNEAYQQISIWDPVWVAHVRVLASSIVKDIQEWESAVPASVTDSRIRQVLLTISSAPEENYSSEEMAARCCLSNSRFLHLFKKEVGLSFNKFLIHKRIQRAKHLLASTSTPVSYIGFEVGYADPNYFSYAFHKETGKSPREYRKNQKLTWTGH